MRSACLLLLLVAPACSGPEVDALTVDGPLGGPTALGAATEMGQGFNLGQMFESTQHPRTLAAAKAKIDAYYARGFRTVRIPVTWTENVEGNRLVFDPLVGQVNRDHPRLAVIAQVVDYALSLPEMYVVINAHHERGLKTYSRAAVLERLWADIADIFRARSHHLLFEILNEPHRNDGSYMPPSEVRGMTGRAYQMIRNVDPERIIIIGGNQYFHAYELFWVWWDLSPVGGGSDPYLMATFHDYVPWPFCGVDQGDFSDAWTSDEQIGPMSEALRWSRGPGKGTPVFLGEWGVAWGSRYRKQECNNIRLWYQTFASTVTVPEIPWAVWDDGGWFKIFEHVTGVFANNLIDCLGGSCDWDPGGRYNAECL
jgi:endoglucanase